MSYVENNSQFTYTEAFSSGVTREGTGYFSSMRLAITSESGTHLSSPSKLMTGTLPSGLHSKNLKKKKYEFPNHRFHKQQQVKKNPMNCSKLNLKVHQEILKYSNHKFHPTIESLWTWRKFPILQSPIPPTTREKIQ